MFLLWIVDLVTSLVFWVMNLLPDFTPTAVVNISDSIALMAPVLSIFPLDLFKFIFNNGLFWMGIQLSWSIVEWVYKKIPGVS